MERTQDYLQDRPSPIGLLAAQVDSDDMLPSADDTNVDARSYPGGDRTADGGRIWDG
jgi:hypothetical protein